jgi:hypothetical protein
MTARASPSRNHTSANLEPSNFPPRDVASRQAIYLCADATRRREVSSMVGKEPGWEAVKDVAASAPACAEHFPGVRLSMAATTNQRFTSTTSPPWSYSTAEILRRCYPGKPSAWGSSFDFYCAVRRQVDVRGAVVPLKVMGNQEMRCFFRSSLKLSRRAGRMERLAAPL